MTAKEKAFELVMKMRKVELWIEEHIDWKAAKQCALIAVDEILDVLEIPEQNIEREYWYEVKYEIKQL